jgi:hypothetical protein
VDNLDPGSGNLPVCGRHRSMIVEALVEARSQERHERLLGFGIARFTVENPSQPTDLRCDRSTIDKVAHTWTGIPGDPCYWCLTDFVEVHVEHRRKVLAPIELDPDDARYSDEVIRRGHQLTRATSMGLVTHEEALATLDRWAAHV